MVKQIFVITILVLFSQINIHAQSEPKSEFGKSFQSTWKNAQAYTLELAESMPEDKYDYRPTEDIMTFREHLIHIAGNLYSLNSRFVEGENSPYPEFDKKNASKEEIITLLKGGFEYVENSLMNLSDEEMKSVSEKFWSPGTLRSGIFLLMRDHMTHHRAQLIIYLRMNSVKPPRYRGW